MSATWYDTYWAALKAVIKQAWPDVQPGQLFMDNSIERRDWTTTLNDREMTGYWVIAALDYEVSDDWAISWPVYQVNATVHRVSPLSAVPTGETATTYLTDLLLALRDAALSASAMGTVLADLPVSANAENPINQSLLTAKLPWQAASLTISSIIVAP